MTDTMHQSLSDWRLWACLQSKQAQLWAGTVTVKATAQ